MNNIDKINFLLDKLILGRCPTCGDALHTGEWQMYFIQKRVHTKYDDIYTKYRYVPLKELQDKYKDDPDCPDVLKQSSKFVYLPFCTMACARPLVNFLNKKEPDEYKYNRHYGLVKAKYGDIEEDEDLL